MMPSAVPKKMRTEAEWQALKAYIIRDRQRIRQEQEADAEVQRQRREREQKQKQDKMTLGETKEQIQDLQNRLAQLTEEKHQLFLSLKKVLNEDDNRRRQAFKESNEPLIIGNNYNLGSQMFLQPLQTRGGLVASGSGPSGAPGTVYKTATGPPQPHAVNAGVKRPRSPASPPNHGQSPYHPYATYSSKQTYQPQGGIAAGGGKPPGGEDHGRRGPEYVRAVLWNKGTAATYGSVYGVAPSQQVYSYNPAPTSYEPVYLPRQSFESKSNEGDKLYLRGGPAGPLPIHPSQSAKPGGISTGFPVRTPHQQTAHGAYLTARANGANSRILYGSAPNSAPPPPPPPSGRYQS